jgi:hypothetical protein
MRVLATIVAAAGLLAATTAPAPAFTPPIGTDKGSLTDRDPRLAGSAREHPADRRTAW